MTTKTKNFFGYIRTLKNYWRDPKGRHDILDFLRAGLFIAAVSLIVGLIISR
ncbi:MAG: hypothetical protein IKZ58_09760 [Selenomonadaceae bacterium]|nr:hypothetical protein [Selenomonadaceae bacterium]